MWPDKETEIDYLNFGYMVDMVVDIATNRQLSPSTIGLYGDWGSGKSTLMRLAKKRIEECDQKGKRKDGTSKQKSLCIEFNGWLFEGYEDTKTSLCGTILDALADEKRFGPKVAEKAKELIKKIDFKKIISKGVKLGMDFLIAGGIGTLTDLTLSSIFASIKNSSGGIDTKQIEEILEKFKKEENTRTDVKNFRNEFKTLLEMSKVENVVVFIDELDRCQPDTILEVFEAMRLFLFVEGTSFIIGADERLIQYAIKSKYKEVPGNNLDIGKEYLEKVIQYPITIPQLNRTEVNQYLSCLLLEKRLEDKKDFNQLLSAIYSLKPDEEFTMELINIKANSIADSCRDEMALSRQISSVLAPSINGNPRQCKRFLNMLYMRLNLAKARQVDLDRNILAKLMLAEYFNPEFFKAVIKPTNREQFKVFENGEQLNDDNPFFNWKDKDWVKEWIHNDTRIGDAKLEEYVYFSSIKNRYGQSNLDQLSPTAKRCYDSLADGTETNRQEALKLVEGIAPGEKAIIASELFSIIENCSTMNVEVLRSYADFSVKVGMIPEAFNNLMNIPASQYDVPSYGQLTPFISKLNSEESEQFIAYLMTNQKLKSTIERGSQLNKLLK